MLTTIEKDNSSVISFDDYTRMNKNLGNQIITKINKELKSGKKTIFLDLENIFFIDFNGFKTLIKIKEITEKWDCNLNLINVSFELQELSFLIQQKNIFETISN